MYTLYGSLTLRDALPSDAAQLAEWWNDGSVMEHAGFPNGLGTTAERIAESLAGDSDDTRRRLMIEYCGRPIGEMSYRLKGSEAEIGIKICDFTMQEKGLGKQALSLLISYLFDSCGCRRIVLDTAPENSRARHVYERLGFRLLRINKDSWRDQLGRSRSSADYELLPEGFINFAR